VALRWRNTTRLSSVLRRSKAYYSQNFLLPGSLVRRISAVRSVSPSCMDAQRLEHCRDGKIGSGRCGERMLAVLFLQPQEGR